MLKHNINVFGYWAEDIKFLMRAQVPDRSYRDVVLPENHIGEHSMFVARYDQELSAMIGEVRKIQPSRAVEVDRFLIGEHVEDNHGGVRSRVVRRDGRRRPR